MHSGQFLRPNGTPKSAERRNGLTRSAGVSHLGEGRQAVGHIGKLDVQELGQISREPGHEATEWFDQKSTASLFGV